MPHIHNLIDFIVVAYIVHDNRVVLVDHKENKTWLPVGGHIELNEDPEEAIQREIVEESGLTVELVGGEKPSIADPGTKPLLPPVYLDIHDINPTHKHIGLVYFAKAKTDQVKLAEREHNDIRWFTKDDLGKKEYQVRRYIRFYAEQALSRLSSNQA